VRSISQYMYAEHRSAAANSVASCPRASSGSPKLSLKRSTSPLLLAVKSTELCALNMLHVLQNLLIRESDGQKVSGDASSRPILHTKRYSGTRRRARVARTHIDMKSSTDA